MCRFEKQKNQEKITGIRQKLRMVSILGAHQKGLSRQIEGQGRRGRGDGLIQAKARSFSHPGRQAR
jgi:hypothetical protein